MRASPKHLGVDGAMCGVSSITKKRHRKHKKPSKKLEKRKEDQVAGGDGIKKQGKRTKKRGKDDDDEAVMRKMASKLGHILWKWKYRPTHTEEVMASEFEREFHRTKQGYAEIKEEIKEEITSEFQENRKFHRTKGYNEIKEG